MGIKTNRHISEDIDIYKEPTKRDKEQYIQRQTHGKTNKRRKHPAGRKRTGRNGNMRRRRRRAKTNTRKTITKNDDKNGNVRTTKTRGKRKNDNKNKIRQEWDEKKENQE